MLRPLLVFLSVVSTASLVGCAAPRNAQSGASAAAGDIAELWQPPADLESRDLFIGPGDAALAPPATGGNFQFVAFKTTGTNPGYDVRDASGRLWSVKLGVEAQPEVTVSRILWAIGFHQPPQYFVREFALTGGDHDDVRNARFRTDPARWRPVDEWSWYDNPFLDTQPFHGLIVAQLMLNNWDLKTSNNRIYQAADPAASAPRRFVVRDLGASLGYSKQFPIFTLLGTAGGQGTKNDIEGFERQGFITGVHGGKPVFDYRGMHRELVDRVTVADVVWLCALLDRLSPDQWQAAFSAGAFPRDEADRFIRKLREKIAQGLALTSPTK